MAIGGHLKRFGKGTSLNVDETLWGQGELSHIQKHRSGSSREEARSNAQRDTTLSKELGSQIELLDGFSPRVEIAFRAKKEPQIFALSLDLEVAPLRNETAQPVLKRQLIFVFEFSTQNNDAFPQFESQLFCSHEICDVGL